VIVAALIALAQITAVRSGKPSLITATITTILAGGQTIVTGVAGGLHAGVAGIADIPRLWRENSALRASERSLRAENDRLSEALATAGDVRAIERARTEHVSGVVAQTIGFDPENQSRLITIDRGEQAGIAPDEGVLDDDGVVGRVLAATPFASTVLLITDPASKVPAVVRRGRWWGIATGTGSRVQMQYISQDAPLRSGDIVVTGEGLSFHAGLPIGRIVSVYHPEGALYQTATIEPAVAFGRLNHVIVVPK
jgi:rod shape-determining protein MreC